MPLQGEPDETHCLVENVTSWWSSHILVPAIDHDQRREQEHDRRQEKSQPEADVLLGIHHGNLACHGPDVDEEVVPHVDPGDGQDGVMDHSFSRFFNENRRSWVHGFVLLRDEGRDVAFEESHSDAEKDQS